MYIKGLVQILEMLYGNCFRIKVLGNDILKGIVYVLILIIIFLREFCYEYVVFIQFRVFFGKVIFRIGYGQGGRGLGREIVDVGSSIVFVYEELSRIWKIDNWVLQKVVYVRFIWVLFIYQDELGLVGNLYTSNQFFMLL